MLAGNVTFCPIQPLSKTIKDSSRGGFVYQSVHLPGEFKTNMKVLLIFALVCATSAAPAGLEDIKDTFKNILDKFGPDFWEDWGEDFGKKMEKWGETMADHFDNFDGDLNKLINDFFKSMKDLRQINKDELKKLFDADQGLLTKCLKADAEKWDQQDGKLEKEFQEDPDFAKAYKLMQNEDLGSSASVPALGLGGFLAMTLFLMI